MLKKFQNQHIRFVSENLVKEGVSCAVYEFENGDSKDLGVVTVLAGNKTPAQKVLSGDKTLEIFAKGKGILKILRKDGDEEIFSYPGGQQEVVVNQGDVMQWKAVEDMIFYEVCYPPFEDGRFKDLDIDIL